MYLKRIMSEIINLEEKANILLKKLNILLDNLSFNLSKDKTEQALCDGYECINEIEKIIKEISKIKDEKYTQNNIFMIKGDLMQKKEKYEKIRKTYILNKNNQLIDSISSTAIQEEISKNTNESNDTNDNNIIIPNISEQNIEKEDNNNDEIFQVNKDLTDLSEEYLYSNNKIFLAKRKMIKCFIKIKNKIGAIPIKTKYFIILIFLIVLLIVFIIGLFGEIFDFIG